LADGEEKVVMAKFHADWCQWCRKMDRETFGDESVRQSLKAFIPVRINVDDPEGLALARKVGVVSIPTVVFFDSSGEVIGKYAGYQSPREMKKILKRHARRRASNLK
ncbi:MAG: thioredoxin family protein, partial [Fidelibacterota bacterium]